MTYPLDRNHFGVRLVVLLTIFIVGLLGFFFVMPVALSLASTGTLPIFCLRAIGAGLMAVGSGWATERLLVPIWPSGRVLEIGSRAIAVRERTGQHVTIGTDQATEILAWYFVVPRDRTSVRRGWYCVACRLSQGEKLIVPYTFVNPEAAAQLPQWPAFVHLASREEREKQVQQAGTGVLEAEHQLRDAERDRWESGVEMQPEHFVQLVAALDTRYPDWPPRRG